MTRRRFFLALGLGSLLAGLRRTIDTPEALARELAPVLRDELRRLDPWGTVLTDRRPLFGVVLGTRPNLDSLGQARHTVTLAPTGSRDSWPLVDGVRVQPVYIYYVYAGPVPRVGDNMVYREYRWQPLGTSILT